MKTVAVDMVLAKQVCVLLSLGASLGHSSKGLGTKNAGRRRALGCPECFLVTSWL